MIIAPPFERYPGSGCGGQRSEKPHRVGPLANRDSQRSDGAAICRNHCEIAKQNLRRKSRRGRGHGELAPKPSGTATGRNHHGQAPLAAWRCSIRRLSDSVVGSPAINQSKLRRSRPPRCLAVLHPPTLRQCRGFPARRNLPGTQSPGPDIGVCVGASCFLSRAAAVATDPPISAWPCPPGVSSCRFRYMPECDPRAGGSLAVIVCRAWRNI